MPVILGLAGANLLLVGLFLVMIVTGDGLVGGELPAGQLLALFITDHPRRAGLPHGALPFVAVGRGVLVANDLTGAHLGLADYCTTGFFNHRETMRVIWLSQAAVIVFGHVIAVSCVRQRSGFTSAAIPGRAPAGCFMVLYTGRPVVAGGAKGG